MRDRGDHAPAPVSGSAASGPAMSRLPGRSGGTRQRGISIGDACDLSIGGLYRALAQKAVLLRWPGFGYCRRLSDEQHMASSHPDFVRAGTLEAIRPRSTKIAAFMVCIACLRS
jgi:hypothetical protein